MDGRVAQRNTTNPSSPIWLLEQCHRLEDENCDVRNLNLNIRRLSRPMISVLAKAIQQNHRIEVVNMTSSLQSSSNMSNGSQHGLLAPFAHALCCHKSLTTLHLSYNRLRTAKSIARSLSQNKSSLLELYLDHNLLEKSTALELAQTLVHNNKLQVLQLNSNRIMDVGGTALAKALKNNKSLRTLGLARNQLGTETAMAISEALSTNVTLSHLSLEENPDMPQATVQYGLYLVLANRAGRYLLKQRDDGDDCVKECMDRQQENKSTIQSTPKKVETKNVRSKCSKGLWSFVLEDLDPSTIFFFLREKPSLVPSSSG